MLLEASKDKHVLAETLHTDGARCQSLISGETSLSSPYSIGKKAIATIQMDGRAIFDLRLGMCQKHPHTNGAIRYYKR